MPVNKTTHPSLETLRAFGLGKLNDAEADAVLQHLKSCPDCCRKASDLPGDSFVSEFGVGGLQVVDPATTINSSVAGLANRVHLRFNEPVDLSSFNSGAVALTGPDGSQRRAIWA